MKKKNIKLTKNVPITIIEKKNAEYSENLSKELSTNPEFSLDVDSANKYGMTDEQKTFIKHYCEFKSIPMAAELSGIDLDTAKSYFVAWSSQQEIRRINRALYQRQFSNKLLSIDEIGRYLSSLITDEDVPLADRVKTMDKVKIAQMLIDLQLYKNEAIENPSSIINTDLETEVKALSINSIKMLLCQKKKEDNQSSTNDADLSPEEEAFLHTLPANELLKLVDSNNKKGESNNDKK